MGHGSWENAVKYGPPCGDIHNKNRLIIFQKYAFIRIYMV